MATPVVTVAAGGLPVTEVTGRGMPVTEASNGRGTAVTKVAARGLPVQYVSDTVVSSGPPLDALTANLTGAYSTGRKLLTAYGGAFYTPIASEVSVWLDQTAAARNLAPSLTTARPDVVTAGPNSRAMFAFNPATNDNVVSTALANTFITPAAGYVVMSFIKDDLPPTGQQNLFADQDVFFSIVCEAGALYASSWDVPGLGQSKTTPEPIVANQPYVVEWIHSGGVLSFRLNGGLTRSVAAPNTGGLAPGKMISVGDTLTKMRVCEFALFSAVPTQAQRDTLVANLKAYIGA